MFSQLPSWFTNLWILVVASIYGIKGTQIFRNGAKKMRQNGVRSNVRFPYGSSGMKKGGKVKKQGYKDRKDESIAMRVEKKNS